MVVMGGCVGGVDGWVIIFFTLFLLFYLEWCDYIIKNISLFGFTVIAVYIVDQFIERASFFFL